MDEYLKNIGLSQAEFEQIRADFIHLLSLVCIGHMLMKLLNF